LCVRDYCEAYIKKVIQLAMEEKALKEENYILVPLNTGVIVVMRKRKGKSKIKRISRNYKRIQK